MVFNMYKNINKSLCMQIVGVNVAGKFMNEKPELY